MMSQPLKTIDIKDIQLGDPVGTGTSGRVFLALWNNQSVALKALSVQNNPEDKSLANYTRELDIFEILHLDQHPSIMQCYGHGFCNDKYEKIEYIPLQGVTYAFFLLEYCENDTLFNYINVKAVNHPPSWEFIYRVALHIAKALAYLHSKNLIHCDLKSDNVLLDKNFNPKLSDFSLSENLKTLKEKVFHGSLFWSAPEAFTSGNSKASDMYSFYAIFSELIAWDNIKNLYPKELIECATPDNFVRAKVHEGLSPVVPPERLTLCHDIVKSLLTFGLSQDPTQRPSAIATSTKLEFVNLLNH